MPELSIDDLKIIEEGLGSAIWVLTNRYNADDPRFQDLAAGAESDARAALELVRRALKD